MTIINRRRYKWWTLASISACLAMLNLDHTAVAVILPQLHRDLGLSDVMQQWVVNSYLLAIGTLLIIGGKITDIIGHRRGFFLGLGGFMAASCFCGLASSGYFLIASRVLQGIFGALLMPNTAIVILNAFPRKEQSTAIGVYAGCASVFLAIGPFLGGVLTDFFRGGWYFGLIFLLVFLVLLWLIVLFLVNINL